MKIDLKLFANSHIQFQWSNSNYVVSIVFKSILLIYILLVMQTIIKSGASPPSCIQTFLIKLSNVSISLFNCLLLITNAINDEFCYRLIFCWITNSILEKQLTQLIVSLFLKNVYIYFFNLHVVVLIIFKRLISIIKFKNN